MTDPRPPRWPVITGASLGATLGIVGLRSLFGAAHDTRPLVAAKWMLGLAIAHDLVLVPVVLAVGVAVRRFVPAAGRSSVSSGLLVSGTVALVAWPMVRGYGRLANNPSILPRNYATGLAITLAVAWTVTVVLGLLTRRRRQGTSDRLSP